MQTVYLDYNATTPTRDEVLEFMNRVAPRCYGNPSSAHLPGRTSRECLEEARRKVAESIGADTSEICFTNGGSESDNLAIKGVADTRTSGHIVTTCIEHPAVRNSCEHLKTRGFDITYVGVDAGGYVEPQTIESAIRSDTFLITVMWVNNETGQIQPIDEIVEIARRHEVLFHTDAVQAFGKIPINVKGVPVDLLSISGHKFYAPKGIGALYVRSAIELVPQIHGGGQEGRLRSGTENIVGAAAMGEACRLAVQDLESTSARLTILRDKLEKGILENVPDTRINGDPARRVPNTTNISFRGIEASQLIRRMDEHGFAISGASACASGKGVPSAAMMGGMGLTEEEAMGVVRLSLGMHSRESHVTRFLDILPGIVRELRVT
jgi:cysteine desulfurase